MKIKLTNSRSSRERYYLVKDGSGMGGHGMPASHYLRQFSVVNGVDRGNGYQGYMSVDYALTCDWLPDSAKKIIQRVIDRAAHGTGDSPKSTVERMTSLKPDPDTDMGILHTVERAMNREDNS